ncbi:hypothetical protein [Halonotius roseus]|uniref:DUF1102 domain-containing protein n=1 Tax=Halonotius roseus TaxID=2511997 RepID=A0A544QLS4_9EURY|nr:hypothetical protein [Halonotius roseus]TQQ79550.1 hypothetical protein EWF95_11095 [Halonotius roseus]
MRLTRRNTLIGLGAVAAGAGVIGGTGAFTSVEADRSISIESTDDSSANVNFVVDRMDKHDSLSDPGDDTVALDFDGLNVNSTTTYDDALSITPQGSNGPYDVTVSLVDGNGDSISWVTTTVNNGTGVSGGTQVDVDIVIDLTENDASSFPTDAVLEISVSQSN